MFISFISILTVSTVAVAQFTFKIVRPFDGEYLRLGGTFPVELHVPNASVETHPSNVQFSLCTEITGLPVCNNTMGRVILTAPFSPPDQTFTITIPGDQQAGLISLVAGHITTVNVSQPNSTPSDDPCHPLTIPS